MNIAAGRTRIGLTNGSQCVLRNIKTALIVNDDVLACPKHQDALSVVDLAGKNVLPALGWRKDSSVRLSHGH